MKFNIEKLFELLWKIQEEYKGIITTEDKQAIDAIILYRIKMIKEDLEHKEALNDDQSYTSLNAFESEHC